jgi:hypothetical protein
MWQQDSLAYADSFDDASNRYRGLRCGELMNIPTENLAGLLVRPEPALKQHEAEKAASAGGAPGGVVSTSNVPSARSAPADIPHYPKYF